MGWCLILTNKDDLQHTLRKLRLSFLAVFSHFLSLADVIPTELILIPTDFFENNGGFLRFLLKSVGITFFLFSNIEVTRLLRVF
jgi:hypothetical protein